MANLIVKKVCDNFEEKIDEIVKDSIDELNKKDDLFYKNLKEKYDIDNEIIEKITESKNKFNLDLESKLKLKVQNMVFNYSKNIVSDLFTYINEKQNEDKIKSNTEILKEINELEENDLEENNHPFFTNDLISSITSDSSVFGQNNQLNSHFNIFNTLINNSDNESSDSSNDDDDNDQQARQHLEDMNVNQIREIAKQNDIILSKNSKKKTKNELIKEIIEKLSN